MFNPIHVRIAFADDARDVRFYGLVESGPDWVRLEPHPEPAETPAEPVTLHVTDAPRLASLLARDDLTKVTEGRPVVAANLGRRLIAFGSGPPLIGDRISIIAVLALDGGWVPGWTFDQEDGGDEGDRPKRAMVFWLLHASTLDSSR